ncbi:hypothetical protein DMUE_3743 [Dictyocoela muelleri]|nr:hypothetical protein DMUE_3743 [Dictyocoela muelleri]
MRHSTTANTPFILMLGLPIRELMQEDLINSIVNNEMTEEEYIQEVTDDVVPVDILNPGNLDDFLREEIENEAYYQEDVSNIQHITNSTDLRDAARVATQRAADRMVARSMWRNDYVEFQI